MKKYNNYNYGLVFGEEQKVIYNSLKHLKYYFLKEKVNLIEIGFNEGKTGKAMIEISNDIDLNAEYYGIDIKEHKNQKLIEGMNYIEFDANNPKILSFFPDKFHLVFIDACHCMKCVLKQFDLYTPYLQSKGILLFHDTALKFQGTPLTEPHGKTKEICEVRKAIENIDLAKQGYSIFDIVEEDNGIQGYIKL